MMSVPRATTASKAKRAAIYCRVSSIQQADGSSLETQEADIRVYCRDRGYAVVEDFA
jgi:DNA invertase Pin-like site-specific DNA recombinase